MSDLMSDRERAIVDAEAMRQTHVEWLDHIENCHLPSCKEDQKIAGDKIHHQDCIDRYDNILAVLSNG